MIYIETGSTDPAYNLAYEQHAFDIISRDDDVFMLWQNSDSVIVGIHQNTFEEVNIEFLEANNIPAVRRLSGGGAVFHDMGNLNYTFITHMADYDIPEYAVSCEPISNALVAMGLPIKFIGRNDMLINGMKFSGNARYFSDGRLMHHGTIMFDVNLEKMENALVVSKEKLESKGIKSVRARVTNLSNYLDISFSEFRERIKEFIIGEIAAYVPSELDLESIYNIKKERYDTREWNYQYEGNKNMQHNVI